MPEPPQIVATERLLKCCGGTTDGTVITHKENCPSIVRAALSWIEESSVGERHRQRGLAAFEAILAERDALLREREPGLTPNECHNPECGTIRYGTGYKVCPSCGSPPAGPDVEGEDG